ncbi:MAG: pilus assembly protein PilM [Verrucomicrobia bacterium]|nr:pilus assembly protein PilM [Verrucomicrobiota bacterium]
MIDFVNLISRKKIVIDLGACDIKVLLLERTFERIKVLKCRLIDFADGGFMTQDESSVELQQILESFGDLPVILIIPEHLSLARLTQFSTGPRRELGPSNLRELSGWFHLAEDEEILWELRLIRRIPGYINAGVLTMVRALDIDDQVQRLGLHESNLIRVTTPANALADAHSALTTDMPSAILIEVGATTTAVVVIESNQMVYSTSFPIGGESLTEVIAAYFEIPFDEAELRKREDRYFIDEELTPLPLKAAVESWLNELSSVLEIQFGESDYVLSELRRRPVLLSGGGALIPGMIDYLRAVYGFRMETWDEILESHQLTKISGVPRFLGAIGAGWAPCHRQSLLPTHLKQKRFAQSIQFFANILSLAIISGIFVFLVICSMREYKFYTELNYDLDRLEKAFGRIQTTDSLMHERLYLFREHYRLMKEFGMSLDWIRSIDALEKAQIDPGLWMVLLADKATFLANSRNSITNLISQTTPDSAAAAVSAVTASSLPLSRLDQPGLISQFVFSHPVDTGFTNINSLVDKLYNHPPFGAVDRMPNDYLHNLVPQQFIISNQTFTLRLDWQKNYKEEFDSSWTNRFMIKLPGKSSTTNSVPSASSTRKF